MSELEACKERRMFLDRLIELSYMKDESVVLKSRHESKITLKYVLNNKLVV